jgi:hypothetical protein
MVLTLGVAGALLAPPAALADDGGSRGDSPSGTQQSSGSGRSGGNDANRTERYELRGRVVSVDPVAQTIVVTVDKANHGHRGRAHLGQTITFDVSTARIDVRDVNGDGVRDLGDVNAGDLVEVRAELPRSGALDLTQSVTAERLKDRSAGRGALGPDPGRGQQHEHRGRDGQESV